MWPRFFLPENLYCNTEILLPKALIQHIRALRLQKGAIIVLFNGYGGEYQARLSALNQNLVKAEVLEFFPYERELPFEITLAQAIIPGNKMDWLVEKVVELGVSAIQPLYTAHSIIKLTDERAKQRVIHWQKLIHAACEQCGRNLIPKIFPIKLLEDWLIQNSFLQGLMLSPQATLSLYESITAIKPLNRFVILVGPEGGLSTHEEAIAQKHGLSSVRLGNRILRCETAGLAAIAGITALLNS